MAEAESAPAETNVADESMTAPEEQEINKAGEVVIHHDHQFDPPLSEEEPGPTPVAEAVSSNRVFLQHGFGKDPESWFKGDASETLPF